ncbi:MAG: arsenate reductase (azurin) large subunit [Jannaschia sp.]
MTFKRQIDRLPIIPADARVNNVTCHYCIVGCGYKAYSWPINRQGGTAPAENWAGVDLSEAQYQETDAWYAPSMYNVVQQDGRDVHLVIKPDQECVVNSGLGSVRGARMAENRRSDITGTQQQRLAEPMVWRYGTWQPTSWDDALDLVAQVTARVVTEGTEDDLYVSMFDHGGSAGGYENTWGTGKLYFESMKIRNVRIHNRPAYNSEVHATRDMGVGELNNAYEDAELADTIMVVGANPLECQTNYFLNHWVPNLQGVSMSKKKEMLPDEPHAPARIIIVDPRRTVTVNVCEEVAGPENVLHLAVTSGTDMVLMNALFTEIAERGWVDQAFIDAHTAILPDAEPADDATGAAVGAAGTEMLPRKPRTEVQPTDLTTFLDAVERNRTTLDEAATITGLAAADIAKAAAWIAEPKEGGARRRTMIGYEKGVIWGNDNYRTNGALVNIALATGNIGREGGGCVRLGGHQEGYMRPSDAHIGRPAPYVDQLLIEGGGKVHHVWACDHYKTTLNATEFKRVYNRRTNMVKEAMDAAAGKTRAELIDAIVEAVNAGGLFSVNVDIIHSKIGQAAHVILPAVESGEMDLTSMNGERRMRLVEQYMDGPGVSMPDCMIAAGLANNMERVLTDLGKVDYAAQFQGYDWATVEDVFMDGYAKNASGGEFVTYDRLRVMGNNGFQEPAVGLDGETIVGTPRLYTDGVFGTDDGRALFLVAEWAGLQAPGKEAQRAKFTYLINNGRSNINWQNWFLDQDNEFVRDRFPYPFIQMAPADMEELGVMQGDLVEVYNDDGATQAMVYPTATARPKETFMLFGSPAGVQGNVINAGVNELVLPNYKQTWANIRKLSDAPSSVQGMSFKSWEYESGV